MLETLVKKDYVSIDVDHELKILMIVWDGSCTSEEYRGAMEKGFDYVKDLKLEGWISDTTNGAAISPDDYKWVTTDLIPRALGIVKKVAVKSSKDIFRQMMTDEIANDVADKKELKLRYFDDTTEAIEWLKS
jgi:hypothetical protein